MTREEWRVGCLKHVEGSALSMLGRCTRRLPLIENFSSAFLLSMWTQIFARPARVTMQGREGVNTEHPYAATDASQIHT